MSYKIKPTKNFEREAKILAKKFPSLKNDLSELSKKLQQKPESGQPLGNNCYKIRMAIASKGKGKSGGARIITYCYVSQETVFLLSIYDKSKQTDISDDKIKELVNQIL